MTTFNGFKKEPEDFLKKYFFYFLAVLALLICFTILGSGCNSTPPSFDLSKIDKDKYTLDSSGLVTIPPFEDTLDKTINTKNIKVDYTKKLPTPPAIDTPSEMKNQFEQSVGIAGSTEKFENLGTFYFAHKAGKTYKESNTIYLGENTLRIEKNGVKTDYKILNADKGTEKTLLSIQDSRLVIYKVILFTKPTSGFTEIQFPSKIIYKQNPIPSTITTHSNTSPKSNNFKVVTKDNWTTLKIKKDCACEQWGEEAWEGLTIYSIAKHYNVPIKQIQDANKTGISVGKKFCIKRNCSSSKW